MTGSTGVHPSGVGGRGGPPRSGDHGPPPDLFDPPRAAPPPGWDPIEAAERIRASRPPVPFEDHRQDDQPLPAIPAPPVDRYCLHCQRPAHPRYLYCSDNCATTSLELEARRRPPPT